MSFVQGLSLHLLSHVAVLFVIQYFFCSTIWLEYGMPLVADFPFHNVVRVWDVAGRMSLSASA